MTSRKSARKEAAYSTIPDVRCEGDEDEEQQNHKDESDENCDNMLSPLNGSKGTRRRVDVASRNRGRGKSNKSFLSCLCGRNSWRINVITLLILLCLGLFGNLSIKTKRITSQLSSLQSELSSDESKLDKLSSKVQNHDIVIQRFNSTVSNKDVMERLQAVEATIEDTKNQLNERMDAQSREISEELAGTLDTLHKAVEKAQAEIQDEVEQVKGDVANFARTTQDQFSMENSFMIYQLAGTFVLIGSLISMWHMTSHLRKFNQPMVQRKILAILWMCPIYAITSWASLVFVSLSEYLGILKDLYEAYIIYMFLAFLIAVLGKGDRAVAVNTLAIHADHLKPPMSLCGPRHFDNPREKADAVLLQCQFFAMQFVLFKPLCSITRLVFEKCDVASDMSHYDYRSPFFYVLIVENLSVFFAFMGLLKFYHAAEENLSWCRPFPKFLCIKGVVFMTFWQGLVISILANTPSLTKSLDSGATEVTAQEGEEDLWAAQAQNFLICLEMLGFAVAHFFAFPTAEWQDGYRVAEKKNTRFGDNMALNDFLQDLKLVLSSKAKSKRKSKNVSSDDTIAEDDDESEDDRATVNVTRRLNALLTSDSYDDEEDDDNEEEDDEEKGNRVSSPLLQDKKYQSNSEEDDEKEDAYNKESVRELRRALAASLLSSEEQEGTASLLHLYALDKCEKESLVTDQEKSGSSKRKSSRVPHAASDEKSRQGGYGSNGTTKKLPPTQADDVTDSISESAKDNNTSKALHVPSETKGGITKKQSIASAPEPSTSDGDVDSASVSSFKSCDIPSSPIEMPPPNFPPPPPPSTDQEMSTQQNATNDNLENEGKVSNRLSGTPSNEERRVNDHDSGQERRSEEGHGKTDGVCLRPSFFTAISSQKPHVSK